MVIKKRIGVFGGSFDPVHLSHINLARISLKTLKLEEVHLIPVFSQSQKHKPRATPFDRLNMLKLATINDLFLKVNTIELRNSSVSYTIDTIRILQKRYDCTLILGSDQINNFCSWKEWEEIIGYVNIAVAQRSNIPINLPNELLSFMCRLGKCISIIPLFHTEISSSLIREYVLKQDNNSTDNMLDPLVKEYIKINNLYK